MPKSKLTEIEFKCLRCGNKLTPQRCFKVAPNSQREEVKGQYICTHCYSDYHVNDLVCPVCYTPKVGLYTHPLLSTRYITCPTCLDLSKITLCRNMGIAPYCSRHKKMCLGIILPINNNSVNDCSDFSSIPASEAILYYKGKMIEDKNECKAHILYYLQNTFFKTHVRLRFEDWRKRIATKGSKND